MTQIMKTSVVSVMRRLGKMRNMMVSIYHPMASDHGYISVFNVIQVSIGLCYFVNKNIIF